MKICIAQTKSEKGNITHNIAKHITWINRAISYASDLILFPELSLSGYEPIFAQQLATNLNDSRLDIFQEISDLNRIVIAVGLPIRLENEVNISMVIFQPSSARLLYSKQYLHSDELPYFIPGNKQTLFKIKDQLLAPAICYEALQEEHWYQASQLGAQIYLASVAKPQKGIDKAYGYFPLLAAKYSMPIIMANSIGFNDNFLSAGQSSVWDANGMLIGKLSNNEEGILVYDTILKTLKSEYQE